MKTRDELAEALLIASVEESKIMPAATAFNLADAFVAERERRAYPLVNDATETKQPHDPDAGCVGCEHHRPLRGHRIDNAPEEMCRRGPLGSSLVSLTAPAPAWCPKRVSATPAAEALKFDSMGDLQHPEGDAAHTTPDGYSAAARHDIAIVRIRTTDRAHAERIVAAMLPIGRGTK